MARFLLPPTTVTSTRLLTVNSDRILGSNDEEQHFSAEMQADVAGQIMHRLTSL